MTDLAKPVVRSPKRAEAWAKRLMGRVSGIILGLYNGFVSVKAFGAVGNGVTDDSGAFIKAVNALAGTGISLWIPAATFAIAHPIPLPNNLEIWGSEGTILNSTMAPLDAHTNSIFTGKNGPINWPTGGTNTTTVSVTVVEGSSTLHVASGAGIANGAYIAVGDGNNYLLSYKVIAGGGTGVLTLDRPIAYPFGVATDVWTYAAGSPPSNILIRGNGMVLQGTGDRGIWLLSPWNCVVQDVVVNSSFTTMGLTFDLGGYRSEWTRVQSNFVANTGFGLSVESNESTVVDQATIDGTFGSMAMEITGAYIEVRQCRGVGGSNGSNAGLFLGAAGSTDPIAARGCMVLGGFFSGQAYPTLVRDASLECTITGVSGLSGAVANFQLDAAGSTGSRPTKIEFIGCHAILSAGYGYQIQGLTEIDFTNCTTRSNASASFNISSSRCTLTGCTTVNDGSAAGAHLVLQGTADARIVGHHFLDAGQITTGDMIELAAGAKLRLSESYMTTTQTAAMTFLSAQTANAYLEVDHVEIQCPNLFTGFGVTVNAATAVAKLDYLKIIGDGVSGGDGVVGIAGTVLLGVGNDLSGLSTQVFAGGAAFTAVQAQGGGEYTDATVTGTVALTPQQALANIIKPTGALTGNITYDVPAGLVGLQYPFANATSNVHTASLGVTGGTAITVLQGSSAICWSDGTNMHRATADSVGT